jgi:hypothetical protein
LPHFGFAYVRNDKIETIGCANCHCEAF